MTVRPGQLEGFKKQANEIIRLTKELDTETLRYDWFLTKDDTECEVRELYASPGGLIEHRKHVASSHDAGSRGGSVGKRMKQAGLGLIVVFAAASSSVPSATIRPRMRAARSRRTWAPIRCCIRKRSSRRTTWGRSARRHATLERKLADPMRPGLPGDDR